MSELAALLERSLSTAPAVTRRTTAGRRMMLALCAEVTQRVVARRVGVTQQCVAEWCSGETRPCPDNRAAVAQAFGIHTQAWGPLPINWKNRATYKTRVSGSQQKTGPCAHG